MAVQTPARVPVSLLLLSVLVSVRPPVAEGVGVARGVPPRAPAPLTFRVPAKPVATTLSPSRPVAFRAVRAREALRRLREM